MSKVKEQISSRLQTGIHGVFHLPSLPSELFIFFKKIHPHSPLLLSTHFFFLLLLFKELQKPLS